MRVLVIGGGILGTMHAHRAVARGHDVVQIERETAARGASVRNFGLVWVSGRAQGRELAAALRARELWEQIGAEVPGIGFRANGSLTVARTEAELAVLQEVTSRPDALERGFVLLEPDKARAVNPALRGAMLGALWCERDAAVEPRLALPALRARLASSGRYEVHLGHEVRAVDTGFAVDDSGRRFEADVVLVCPGAALGGLVRELAPSLPVRRVRLQMLQTDPLDEPLTTSVADGDSLRYYPAFNGPALAALRAGQDQPPAAAAHAAQLLVVQRLDGGLTIGDTHSYDEPFPFDLDTAPYEHLEATAADVLGRPLPRVSRRWAGVYAQAADGALVHREQVRPGVWLVTGPGGRGMTLSPAIAETTAEEVGL